MPPSNGRSPIFSKLGPGFDKAWDAHKNDETTFGQAELPEGIEGGIAQVVDAKLDLFKDGDNKGKPYFMMQAVVVAPAVHNGIPIKGMRTRIGPEPICDTPKSGGRKTLAEHVAWMQNELRKVDVHTADMSAADLEAALASLVEDGPYIRFRTWKGKATDAFPNPRVNHQWNGLVPDDFVLPDDGVGGVEDGTANAAPASPPAAPGRPAPATKPPARPATPPKPAAPPAKPPAKAPAPAPAPATKPGAKGGKAPPPPPTAAEATGDDFNLDELADVAAGDDDAAVEAQEQLTNRAMNAGISEDDCNAAPDWQALVAMIREAEGGGDEAAAASGDGDEAGGDEGGDEPPADWKPEKGEVYSYAAPNPKKPGEEGPDVEVEVVGVDLKRKLVTLKNMRNPKLTYQAVPWKKLKGAE